MARGVDVVVVGSGPAGLQTALTLARGQRSVVVVEGRERRNARAHAIHNVITRDGSDPEAFRAVSRSELRDYDVSLVSGEATAISGEPGALVVQAGAHSLRARRVVLAVGMRDRLPDWPGLAELWGPTVFQCPFCHGHELRGQRWAYRATSPQALGHVGLFRAWTHDLVVVAEGFEPDEATRRDLEKHGVALHVGEITQLDPSAAHPERLAAIHVGGERVPCRALILHPPQEQVPLVQALGLTLTEAGYVQVDDFGRTSAPGIWAAADLCTPLQSVVGGMGRGQLAAAGLCMELAQEDWQA